MFFFKKKPKKINCIHILEPIDVKHILLDIAEQTYTTLPNLIITYKCKNCDYTEKVERHMPGALLKKYTINDFK